MAKSRLIQTVDWFAFAPSLFQPTGGRRIKPVNAVQQPTANPDAISYRSMKKTLFDLNEDNRFSTPAAGAECLQYCIPCLSLALLGTVVEALDIGLLTLVYGMHCAPSLQSRYCNMTRVVPPHPALN